jgi:hypothetical protein
VQPGALGEGGQRDQADVRYQVRVIERRARSREIWNATNQAATLDMSVLLALVKHGAGQLQISAHYHFPSRNAEHARSASRIPAGGLQRRFHLGGAGIVKAETFGVGHHVREGELCLAVLPPAVFKEVIGPYFAVAAGLFEGDRAGLQESDQRRAGNTQQVCRLLGRKRQAVRATVTARPAFMAAATWRRTPNIDPGISALLASGRTSRGRGSAGC